MSGLVPVATTLGGLALGGFAGWFVGFATAPWSMEGAETVVACSVTGAVIGAAVGAYVGARIVS